MTIADSTLLVRLEIGDGAMAQRSSPALVLAAWEYWVEAEYRGDRFDLVIDPNLGSIPEDPTNPTQGTDTTTSAIYRAVPGRNPPWEVIYMGSGNTWPDNNTLAADFPLDALEAVDGFVPGPGEPIRFLRAVAFFDEGPGSPHEYPREGAMVPLGNLAGGDEASFPADAVLALPVQGTANLALSTPLATRFSNGQATTYHWPVAVRNLDTAATEGAISVTGADDLQVDAPEFITLQGGEEKVIDVFATAPFQHDHGGSRELRVSIDGSAGSASLGLTIHYLDVPQPAGHHNTLYLHAKNPGGGSSGAAWLDTVDEPERPFDPAMELGPMTCDPRTPTDTQDSASGTFYELDPTLLIGIDSRIEETARLRGTLNIPVTDGGLLAMKLVAYDPLTFRDGVLQFDDDAVTQEVAASAQAQTIDIDVELPIPPPLDYMPPGNGTNLGLFVVFCNDQAVSPTSLPADATTATLAHGASLSLPLNEFHDRIPVIPSAGIRLTTPDATRKAAPGADLLWNVVLGADRGTYDARLIGPAIAHAQILTDGPVKPGNSIPVHMQVPDDARALDSLEVVLIATDRDDSTRTGAIRLVASVDPASDADDGQAIAGLGDGKDTPAPSALLGLLAVALALVRRLAK